MPVIKTGKFFVCNLPPEPHDLWVRAEMGTRCLIMRDISNYHELEEWAIDMATSLQSSLEIVPFDIRDMEILNWKTVVLGPELMPPNEVLELQRSVVTTCAELMLNSKYAAVQTYARTILIKMEAAELRQKDSDLAKLVASALGRVRTMHGGCVQ